MTNRSHGSSKAWPIAGVVIAAVFASLFAYALGIFGNLPQGNTGVQVLGGGGDVDESTWLSRGDFIDVTIKAVDVVTGDTKAEDTAIDSVFLNRISGDYFSTGQSAGTTASTHYLAVGDEDDVGVGSVCLYTEPKSGQSFIFAYTSLNQYNNNLVTYMKYIDVQSAAGLGDGNKEWTFCVSTLGKIPYSDADGTTPPMQITVPLWNEATMTDDAPSDITGVGEAAGTLSDIKWTLTGTKGDVTFVTKLQLKYNDTDLAEVNEGQTIVHFNGATYTLSEFDDSLDSDETIFEYDFGQDISDAMPIIFPQNVGSATTELKLTTSWDMDNNDEFNVIYTLYIIDETGALTTITDTVLVTEA